MHRITLFFLSLFCLFISVVGLFRWDGAFLRQGNILPVKALVILAFAVFLFLGIRQLYRFLKNSSKLTKHLFLLFSVLIIVAGQIAFLIYFQPQLRYDALKTFDQAVEMLRTHTISPTYEKGYFARYTNNYPITILIYWILSLASAVGVTPDRYMLTIQLLNIVLIDISLYLGYEILRVSRRKDIGLLYVLLCLICPTTYLWAGFFYTSTLSMPFFMGILLVFARLFTSGKSLDLGDMISLGLSLGLCIVMGYKARATAMIAFIAFVIVAIWALIVAKKKPRCSVFGTIGAIVGLGAAAFLSLSAWGMAVDHYAQFDYQNTGFPLVHWVMMGMRWDGAYDMDDELYTDSFPTKAEKSAADKELLISRVKEAGPTGLVVLAGRKLLNTWVDGTDTYEAEDSAIRYGSAYGKPYEYLIGNKDALVRIYSQVFRVLQMLIIGVAALLLFIRLCSKEFCAKQKDAASNEILSFLLRIAFLGGMGFHLIWETNPLYSLSFYALGILLLADSIDALFSENIFEKQKIVTFASAGTFALVLVLLGLGYKQLVDTPIEQNSYVVNQYHYSAGGEWFLSEFDQTFEQTFRTDKPFNRLSLQAINPTDGYNQSFFDVVLKDDRGTIVFEDDLFLPGRIEKNKFYEFVMDEIVPDHMTTYTLNITPIHMTEVDTVCFRYYTTGNEDMYPEGHLAIAGKPIKKGDLAFAVYKYEITTYYNLKVYLLICAALLVLCGGITGIEFLRLKKA